jgi:hypothetical protein
MDRPRANRKPSFRAQATLIVLPVVILASVGAWSLRQDRLLAEQEARDRARQLAEMLLPELAEALARLHTHAVTSAEAQPGARSRDPLSRFVSGLVRWPVARARAAGRSRARTLGSHPARTRPGPAMGDGARRPVPRPGRRRGPDRLRPVARGQPTGRLRRRRRARCGHARVAAGPADFRHRIGSWP